MPTVYVYKRKNTGHGDLKIKPFGNIKKFKS